MQSSKRRPWVFCVFLCVCSASGLSAADGEQLLFDLSDERGNRISIHRAGTGETLIQFIEEGEILLLAKPLTGDLEIGGLTVSPFRVWLLGRTTESQTVSATVPRMALLTSDAGSTTPPSGPPPVDGLTSDAGSTTPPSGPPDTSGDN